MLSFFFLSFFESQSSEEIDVKSAGLDKTTIITLTNDGSKDVKIFRIWLSQDTNFQSFKTNQLIYLELSLINCTSF